ncbi:hypothetical protein CA85_33160 [Allorhodopirellula solitaria]|uniref:Uncharacterized protein n=1 Tax=Allorhodopirellula solitaria TaxID=2527987 RepID=A0A5C5XR37_9BACT|nr:hypothetical protein CA85_33160 [Allorhodopirellula solitaria]
MIAINKPLRRNDRPDPPWPIDAHASLHTEVDSTSSIYLSLYLNLKIGNLNPFSMVHPTEACAEHSGRFFEAWL